MALGASIYSRGTVLNEDLHPHKKKKATRRADFTAGTAEGIERKWDWEESSCQSWTLDVHSEA